MKASEVRQQRGFHAERYGKRNFNCGTTSERMKGNNYNFNLCEACIIHNENKRMFVFDWSSYKERKGNALASGADEGRDKLR